MQTDFDSILFDMYDTTDLNVIVTFVDEYHVRRLLVTQHLYGFDRFSWVGTETWSVDPDLFEGFENQAAGSLAIVPSIGDMAELQQYLTNVPVQDAIDRNPWLAPALSEIFPCRNNITKRSPYSRNSLACVDLGADGLGRLITMRQYNDDIFHVINAFFALAYGADQLRQALCTNQSEPVCMEYFNAVRSGTEFYEAVANVTFTTGGQQFAFINRSGPPTFTIQNFQHQIGSGIQFVNVSGIMIIYKMSNTKFNETLYVSRRAQDITRLGDKQHIICDINQLRFCAQHCPRSTSHCLINNFVSV